MTDTPQEIADECFDIYLTEMGIGMKERRLIISYAQSLLSAKLKEKDSRIKELEDLINSPELNDFLKGVKLESTHQTERWGKDSERDKLPHHYALVLDKLKGKQALAIWDRDIEKYKHHLITMASVCYNMHRQIDKEGTAINQWFNPL